MALALAESHYLLGMGPPLLPGPANETIYTIRTQVLDHGHGLLPSPVEDAPALSVLQAPESSGGLASVLSSGVCVILVSLCLVVALLGQRQAK